MAAWRLYNDISDDHSFLLTYSQLGDEVGSMFSLLLFIDVLQVGKQLEGLRSHIKQTNDILCGIMSDLMVVVHLLQSFQTDEVLHSLFENQHQIKASSRS
jgi:hypothetical protein